MQRPLWASTGVKDPQYPETKYVDTLVGPHTVNTMPMPTLLACAEQLEVHAADGRPGPHADLQALADAGIDMGDVTEEAPQEGIQKFVEPFDALMEGIELAREGVVTGRPPTIKSALPDELEPAIVKRVQQARTRTWSSAYGARTSRSGAAPACPRSRTAWAGSRSATRCSTTRTSCASSWRR